MRRRCSFVAVVVGTLLTVINQADAFSTGVTVPAAFAIAANYVIPFIVSNLGAMSTDSAAGP